MQRTTRWARTGGPSRAADEEVALLALDGDDLAVALLDALVAVEVGPRRVQQLGRAGAVPGQVAVALLDGAVAALAGVEEEGPPPVPGQPGGRGQPGRSAADHHRIPQSSAVGHRTAAPPPAAATVPGVATAKRAASPAG